MTHLFSIIQLVSAPLLIALILLQRAPVDAGSSGDTGSFSQTRRGFEKFLFTLTIIMAVIFAAASLLVIIYSR